MIDECNGKSHLYLDTDLISSFLRIGEKDLLISALKDDFELYVPHLVAKEIYAYNTQNDDICNLINEYNLLKGNCLIIELDEMQTNSAVFTIFCLLTSNGENDDDGNQLPVMHLGEAEMIARAIYDIGSAASNNLKDVARYCKKHNIQLITSQDVLYKAFKSYKINKEQANNIWNKMKKVQMMAYNSFDDFLSSKGE